MKGGWEAIETTTHQDHVIAHVLGATVMAYFVLDETLHLLLNIGFIWTIYLDGQMVMLPYPVAVAELEIDQQAKAEIKNEIERVLGESEQEDGLQWLSQPPVHCLVTEVQAHANGERRRFVLIGEDASLMIETSIENRGILVGVLDSHLD
ncbi:MAG: hypothetical protein ACRD6N_19465 [Pyrinomonadaceae bacterium]